MRSVIETCCFLPARGPSLNLRAVWPTGKCDFQDLAAIPPLSDRTLDQVNKDLTLLRFARFGGNKTATARSLGIGRRTLDLWLEQWGVHA